MEFIFCRNDFLFICGNHRYGEVLPEAGEKPLCDDNGTAKMNVVYYTFFSGTAKVSDVCYTFFSGTAKMSGVSYTFFSGTAKMSDVCYTFFSGTAKMNVVCHVLSFWVEEISVVRYVLSFWAEEMKYHPAGSALEAGAEEIPHIPGPAVRPESPPAQR